MAVPPSNRRLLVEDFPPDQQAWIGSLLQILNQFMDQTTFALSRNLTLRENALTVVRELSFKGNATITGDITSGSPSLSNVNSTVSLSNGMRIQGTGIPSGTTITNIVGNTITMSNNATTTLVGISAVVGSNEFPTFRYDLTGKPISLRIGQIYENISNPEVMLLPVHVDWEYLNGQIIINHITGLKANMNYIATVIVDGG